MKSPLQTDTPVCDFLATICILVSVPSAFSQTWFEWFSGELPHEFWWQNATMAFQHGAAGMPVAILGHLALNLALLLTCGRMVERLLGSCRVLILTITAWVGFIATQWISGIWINGSSGIIWAYSPFLLTIIRKGKLDSGDKPEASQARILLVVMWGVVTVFMGFVPLLFNPTLNFGYTFFFGNLFHASATLLGFVFYAIWARTILTK
jgi:membrane associated rhomboid family serine protease